MSVITDPNVRRFLSFAWQESNPETPEAHEEGGFILTQPDGTLSVERWPRGSQDKILIPSHGGGQWNGLTILATFHTHPNTGPEFLQSPGPIDIKAVRDDPNLGHAEYEGEFVIATELVYLILKLGLVTVVGRTDEILAEP